MPPEDPKITALAARARAALTRRAIRGALSREDLPGGLAAFRVVSDNGSIYEGHLDDTPLLTIQRLVDDLEAG